MSNNGVAQNSAPLKDAFADKYNFYRNQFFQDRQWRDSMGYPYIEDNHLDFNVYKNYYTAGAPTFYNYKLMSMYNPNNTRRIYNPANIQPYNS